MTYGEFLNFTMEFELIKNKLLLNADGNVYLVAKYDKCKDKEGVESFTKLYAANKINGDCTAEDIKNDDRRCAAAMERYTADRKRWDTMKTCLEILSWKLIREKRLNSLSEEIFKEGWVLGHESVDKNPSKEDLEAFQTKLKEIIENYTI